MYHSLPFFDRNVCIYHNVVNASNTQDDWWPEEQSNSREIALTDSEESERTDRSELDGMQGEGVSGDEGVCLGFWEGWGKWGRRCASDDDYTTVLEDRQAKQQAVSRVIVAVRV